MWDKKVARYIANPRVVSSKDIAIWNTRHPFLFSLHRVLIKSILALYNVRMAYVR